MSLPRMHSPAPFRARTAAALLAAVLVTVALGACSGGGNDAGSEDSSAGGSTGAADGLAEPAQSDGQATDRTALEAPADAEPASTGSAASPALALGPDQLVSRAIIRTGLLSLVADDPEATRDRIAGLVTALGGYVSDESANLRSDGVDQIRVVLRVPTTRFDDAVERISALGRVTSRSVTAEDVTGQVADVDSRVESARAALERIRALMDRATSLGTVIRLEGVLSKRQADLESLLAQQSALAGQTRMGTVEVDVVGKRPAGDGPDDGDDTRGFVDGLRMGWDGLHDSFVAASTVAGAVLPFALLAVLLALPVLGWRRRRISPQPVTDQQ